MYHLNKNHYHDQLNLFICSFQHDKISTKKTKKLFSISGQLTLQMHTKIFLKGSRPVATSLNILPGLQDSKFFQHPMQGLNQNSRTFSGFLGIPGRWPPCSGADDKLDLVTNKMYIDFLPSSNINNKKIYNATSMLLFSCAHNYTEFVLLFCCLQRYLY